MVHNVAHHKLGLGVPLPSLVDRIKHQVNSLIAIERFLHTRRPKHNRGQRAQAVGCIKTQVLALGSHATATAHTHRAKRKKRTCIAATKRLQRFERRNRRHGKLLERNKSADLSRRNKILSIELAKLLLQAHTQRIDVYRFERNAHRTCMTTKTQQQIGAGIHRRKQIDRTHTSAATTRNAIRNAKQQRRHVIARNNAAGYDAFDALMPTLTCNNNHAARSCVHRLGHGHRFFRKALLDLAAASVDVLELVGKRKSCGQIIRQKQVERHIGVAHASRCIKARN